MYLAKPAPSWPATYGPTKTLLIGKPTRMSRQHDESRGLRHGSIWWAALPDPAGRRPVLVLTRDDVLGRIGNVTVAPLTRTDRGLPTEVRLTRADGVPTSCVISLDNILTIRHAHLHRHIAQLS